MKCLIKECDSYDKNQQWDIVCDNLWKLPLSQSVLMIGVLLGNLFFGSFSDRYGRKALFNFAPIICFTSSFLTSFAPNIYVFTILTAITAACIVGMSQASFIIGRIEFIGNKYRVLCVNLQEIVYSLGTVIPGIGSMADIQRTDQ
ncbi:unnamed protein product [Medioppia subpectinata]|uniref:Major facilitator superfamily (MFS) profile domain-containing protein n=1 Tax=Medioppia subpectinata TaxID=1979941 RepID=A0A7R9KY21_9ACAR|nr:unnamed protein product [Medioppia subpectinata]CAG2111629.1 unnamed protein product [Medioppia subpectinata]